MFNCTLSPYTEGDLAAASCFIELAAKESDNNVKLIVLDRLEVLRQKHERVIDSLVMDILRVLSRFVFVCYLFELSLTFVEALIWKSDERQLASVWLWSRVGM